MSQPKQPLKRKSKNPGPGQIFLYALLCYGGAALLFFVFHGLEHSGSSATMPWWIVLLYKLGGKWFVAGVFTLLGTLCLLGAFAELNNKQKRPNEPNSQEKSSQ